MTTKKSTAPAKSGATSKKAAPKKTAPEVVSAAPAEAVQGEIPAEIAPETIDKDPGPTGICIVIPFLSKAAKGNELLYAVRSWEKHLKGLGRIVIIGDSLPWFGKDIVHIPHKPVSNNPQIDTADKMATAIASDLVPEVFVWSNDDIYPVSDLLEADLEVLKAVKGNLAERGEPGSDYRANAARTRKALQSLGMSHPHDYDCHAPVVFEKKKLAQTLAKFACQKDGHLVSSLYFNTHFPNVRPVIVDNGANGSIIASVWSANPNREILERVFRERKFINHNDRGWPHVKPFLEKLFPEKSRFEK